MQYFFRQIIIRAGFLLCSTAVSASQITLTPADELGPLAGGQVTRTVTSPGASASGAAVLDFILVGFGTTCCSETFKLSIDNQLYFSGVFDFNNKSTGNSVAFEDSGVSIFNFLPSGTGGQVEFKVNHTLTSGINTYVFDYGNAVDSQGWGIHGISVTANISSVTPNLSSVPLPLSSYLFATGLLSLMGLRRNKQKI